MQIVRTSEELARACAEARAAGRLALVPTMGALHAGHLALVSEGKRRVEQVAVSIFVNPLQFNDSKDLERYPRTEEDDLAKLEAAGCDLVWLPTREELYPAGFATTVSVKGVSERWEGEHRPGHFDGVATVVAKLLISTVPNFAIFGEKDWQQLAVIRRLAADLNLGAEIVGVPTVREPDGLAMSSRNALLTAEQRKLAIGLPVALERARDAIRSGEKVGPTLAAAKNSLLEGGFLKIDYFALVDAETLEPLDGPAGNMRLIAAATMGATRLIDNLAA